MAVLVVELLEVVNVHEHHRQRAVVSLGTFNFLGQLVLQRTPVVAAGQAVGGGQVPYLLQQLFELGRAFIHQVVKVVDVVRASNTEPLLRLNIESRKDQNPKPMQDYVDELTQLIQG